MSVRSTRGKRSSRFDRRIELVRPFDWGLEWVDRWPLTKEHPRNGHSAEEYLGFLNRAALENSDAFYA